MDERQYKLVELNLPPLIDRTTRDCRNKTGVTMLMSEYAFRSRVQREICARSAGPGLHPGAAEHSSLFKYHGLPIRLLRARQPDAACHVDYQPGSEIGYSSSGTQVNHAS